MIKKICLSLLALVLVAYAVLYISYLDFKSERFEALASGSEVIETAVGPIEYQIVGESGPVLLFLHGTPGGYDQAITIEEYRVLVPSRPGYLRTPIEAGRTPAQQARAYSALLDELEIDRVFVMGASGGGPSAISFAAIYPERTNGLVAMEAVSQRIELPAEVPFFLKSDFMMWGMLSAMGSFMGPEAIVSMMVPDPANQQLILTDSAKTESIEGLMWSIWPVSKRDIGQQNDMTQFQQLDLPNTEVTVPTLIVHGTNDVNVPFVQGEALATQIPHATFAVIEGADHMMPFSHSEMVDEAVEQFIRSLDDSEK